jgi:sugar lactone lactonase YvrE
MKQAKFLFFSLFLSISFFYGSSILAISSDQFPDVLRLQPIPPGVRPGNPGNADNNGQNPQSNSSLLQGISQGEFDESELNPNTSYTDTADHLLFIADTDNNRVFVFELNADNVLVDYVPDYVLGQPDFTASDPGTTQSTFNGPTGIAYDPDDHLLFVADTNNNRIMVFDVSSISNGENAVNVLGQPDFTSSDPGTTQSSLDSPYGLEYDRARNILFVTDVGNNRVVAFTIATATISNGENAVNVLGQPNFTSSSPGTTQSSLNSPAGIAYDPVARKLFVADTKNNRTMVFDVVSVNNGENAFDIFSPNESSGMDPSIAERMQAAPPSIAASSKGKNGFSGSILIWLIILLTIAAFAVFLFLRAKKKSKRKK